MRTTARLRLIGTMVVACCLLAAACGDDDDDAGSAPATTAAPGQSSGTAQATTEPTGGSAGTTAAPTEPSGTVETTAAATTSGPPDTTVSPEVEKSSKPANPDVTEVVYDFGTAGGPEECNPSDAQVAPLTAYGVEPAGQSEYNVDAQTFTTAVPVSAGAVRITVHSIDPADAQAYFETPACFETIEARAPSGQDYGSESPEHSLLIVSLEALAEAGKISAPDFAAGLPELEQLAASLPASTLADVLEQSGIDLGDVTTRAVDRNVTLTAESVRIGAMSAQESEVIQAQVRKAIDEALQVGVNGEETSELAADVLVPSGDFEAVLAAGGRVIEFEFEPSEGTAADLFVVHYVIDPRLSYSDPDWYSWKRSTYVNASANVTDGRLGLYIYRDNLASLIDSTVKTAVSWTTTVRGSSSSSRWYRLQAFGWQNGTVYDLYGTWRGEKPT